MALIDDAVEEEGEGEEEEEISKLFSTFIQSSNCACNSSPLELYQLPA